MNDHWLPSFHLEVIEVIQTRSTKGVRVGSPESSIGEIIGEAELPVAKLSKRSKIYNHLYGNVSLLTENGQVIAINIELHGKRMAVVTRGETEHWRIDDWMKLADREGWTETKNNQVLEMIGSGIRISLSQEGKVDLISLR